MHTHTHIYIYIYIYIYMYIFEFRTLLLHSWAHMFQKGESITGHLRLVDAAAKESKMVTDTIHIQMDEVIPFHPALPLS